MSSGSRGGSKVPPLPLDVEGDQFLGQPVVELAVTLADAESRAEAVVSGHGAEYVSPPDSKDAITPDLDPLSQQTLVGQLFNVLKCGPWHAGCPRRFSSPS